ncbi:MAG: UDP-N-acetylglucosamine 1-carboxyvinyltransferase [Deltaproteobacteria bacterium]|nr:UDP-N-acetylglucosamine 1-carboxyvinyltransferase [Deltaproteobacteria bacterium]
MRPGRLIIKGGCRPVGKVEISGAKNAALPLLMATLLAKGEHRISNVPDVTDVHTAKKLLEVLGAKATFSDQTMTIDTTALSQTKAPDEIVRQMRASILALGPLLARFGEAEAAMPGGCAIGERPVNIHLDGLSALGAMIGVEKGYIRAKANRLAGARIRLDFPTVTGTENLMMAATLARGKTIIENAAQEPEIVDLSSALNAMGAQISGAGTEQIKIEGVRELHPLQDYEVMGDRVEAGTFLIAAAATRGDLLLERANSEYLIATTALLRQAGAVIEADPAARTIRVKGPERLKSIHVVTAPYPGFPTDLQAQMMAAVTTANGRSTIREEIFENRLMQVKEMQKMGAAITVRGNMAEVNGLASSLRGSEVRAMDLRASASLIILGMMAEGTTEITGIEHLDRGYERIEQKLAAVGVDISRLDIS